MANAKSLLVVWQNKNSRSFYHIGTLSYYKGMYEFTYTHSSPGEKKLGDALRNGYLLHPSFPVSDKIYRSNALFPAFDRRLPSEKRFDYTEILSDLGLDENASKMDLLESTRGRLASDAYSFELPLRVSDNKLKTQFFVNGMRHRNLPANWYTWFKIKDPVVLKIEPTNVQDNNAVAIFTQGGKHVGYVPAFYSTAIFSLLKSGMQPDVRIEYINEKSTSHWWLKIAFECEIPFIEETKANELTLMME